MKTIFTIQTQHDGLQNAGFSNISALHNFLIAEFLTKGSTITIYSKDGKPASFSYNYEKLRYSIRMSQKNNQFVVAQIEDCQGSSITISELGILSK